MLGKMMGDPLLISGLIAHAQRYHADTEIVSVETTGGVERSNWGQVERNARRLASALGKLGMQAGDRCATIAWNNRRHLEIYFGVSGGGPGSGIRAGPPLLPCGSARPGAAGAERPSALAARALDAGPSGSGSACSDGVSDMGPLPRPAPTAPVRSASLRLRARGRCLVAASRHDQQAAWRTR